MDSSVLLDEIWLHIFQFFEFETLQKTLTLVCKKWYNLIRNDTRLSGSLKIYWRYWESTRDHYFSLDVGSINTRLKNWPKLQNLQLELDTFLVDIHSSPPELIELFDGIDFEVCQHLKNIQLITGKHRFIVYICSTRLLMPNKI